MNDVKAMLNKMNITQAGHLPVVAAFCRKIGLADTVNSAVPTEMAVDVGTVVKLMVLDTLSGRSPLYRWSASQDQWTGAYFWVRTSPLKRSMIQH